MSEPILFWSTNDRDRAQEGIDFSDALMKGLAPDKGLYMMDRSALPRLTEATLAAFRDRPYHEIAYEVLRPFVAGRVPDTTLAALCEDAYDFDVPVTPYAEGRYLMRLDRGPTASFKDFAARMMARLMQFHLAEAGRSVTILTATSGDTGGAVAAAFHGLDNIRVVVLFPGDEVSARQRRQMTTLGGNVIAIDVDGKFDDCQALVKQAFVDPDLSGLDLTSANSINVGRLLPQSVYYIYAASRLPASGRPLVVCVPSGNFGNLMGGLLAKHMGLPVRRFVAAVNENDEFPVYLRAGDYAPVVPSRNCLSNAMNVGHPSNLARLIALYGGAMDDKGTIHAAPDFDAIHRDVASIEVTDAETREAIRDAWTRHETVLEPHGAVGYKALEKMADASPEFAELMEQADTLLLETADPAKFPEIVREEIGLEPTMPVSMARQQESGEVIESVEADYEAFKTLLARLLR